MKTVISRCFPSLLFLVMITSVAWADKQTDNPAYYVMKSSMQLNVPAQNLAIGLGGGNASLVMPDEKTGIGSQSIGGAAVVGGPSTYSATVELLHICPNRDYECTVQVARYCSASVTFAPTELSKFVIYIDGVPGTGKSFGTAPDTGLTVKFKIRIALPNNYSTDPAPDFLPAGTASHMVSDKPIMFFGLGRMRNGNPAGVVGFRKEDFSSASFFTPATLYFSSLLPRPNSEVDLIYSSGTILHQILSREVLVDINAVSGSSYTLSYYPRSVVSQPAGIGTVCTFTGSPFITYTISQNTSSGIAVTRIEDGITWETDLLLSGSTWTFYDWHVQGTSLISKITTAYSTSTAATVTATGPASGLSGDTAFTWSKAFVSYSWGLELSQTVRGVSETTPVVSNFSYYTTSAATGTSGAYRGLPQWITNSDGTWSAYNYYVGATTTGADGFVQRMYHPWLDTTAPDSNGTVAASASTANSAYDDYTYTYVAKGADTAGTGATSWSYLPGSIISYAPGGNVLNKSTWIYNTRAATLNTRNVWSSARSEFFSSGSALVTTTLSFVPLLTADVLDDQPVSISYPDGHKDSYAYINGIWNSTTNAFTGSAAGNDRLILCFHGQTSGGTAVSSWTSGSVAWMMDSVSMVGGYSTVSESVIDTNGRTIFSGKNIYTTSGTLARVAGIQSVFDSHGRLTDTIDIIRSVGANQFKSHANYNAALVSSQTAEDGIVTSYQYDDLLRETQRIVGVGGSSIYPAKTISTTYDGINRPVAKFACSCGTAPTRFWYDSAGRLIQKSDPAALASGSLVTTYSYSSVTSTTTTLPTGATITNSVYADGRPKSISGNAQAPSYISYASNTTGLVVTHVSSTTATDQSQGWSVDQFDLLGRSVSRSGPTYLWGTNPNNIIDVSSSYDPTTGLLSKQSTTYRATGAAVSPDHLYFYGADGRLTQDGLDLDGSTNLTANSNDRFASYGLSYATDGWGWTSIATKTTFAKLNDATPTQVSKVVTRLTGFNGGTIGTSGLVVADIASTDVDGQISTLFESIDAATIRHHTDIYPPGVSQIGWDETINGYAAESARVSGLRTKNEYDSLGRLVTIRSRWNGTSYAAADTVTFVSTNYSKQPDSRTVDGVVTNFGYALDQTAVTFTVTSTDAQGNTAFTSYNAMGLPSITGGTGTPHVEYGYDALGRRTSMSTWRNGYVAGGPAGDKTIWTIENATGLGVSKILPDTNHIDFTYTPLGMPLTRTWARGSVTTYHYFDGSTTTSSDVSHRTQELQSITYSDTTSPVSFTYLRSGLLASASDVTGQRNFGYAAGQPMRPISETLSSFFGGRVETQQYDAVFRPSGFLLGASVNSASDLSQVVTYNAASGLTSTLSTTPNNQGVRTFSYSFAPNTELLAGYSTGTAGSAFALTYGYEANSNRRNLVKNTMGGVTLVEFDPNFDNRGQVKSAQQSGTAYADYYTAAYNSVLNAYTYDAKGQLQQAATYRGSTNVSAPVGTDELPGHHFEFRYDSMGNRTSAGETGLLPASGGTDDSYTINSLNQYTDRTNYTVRVLGTTATAPVGKNLYTAVAAAVSTNQLDRSWAADIVPGQGTGAASATVAVYAAVPTGGVGGKDLLQTDTSKSYLIAPTPQVFHYDEDGNLKDDGVWKYTYNGENRLIGMENLASAIGAGKIAVSFARKLVFVYDYMGRRVEKQVYGGYDGSSFPTAVLDRKFIYNGWNVVAEYNALSTMTLKRSYTWGLDITGSFGATAGVGALLMITEHATTNKNYYVAYDHNGNVAALERDDATLAAGYEYSPFGELMRVDTLDATVQDNAFRFSTKYSDLETGLVYYGLRYYTAKDGRFINRDPIEEQGGINLYAMNRNRGVSGWDVLGLTTICYDEIIDGVETTVCVTDSGNIPNGATFLGGCNGCSLDANGNLNGTTYTYTPTANGGFTNVATNHSGGLAWSGGTTTGGAPSFWAEVIEDAGAFSHVYNGHTWVPWDEENNKWASPNYNMMFLQELPYQIPVFSIGYKLGTAFFGQDQFSHNQLSGSGLVQEAVVDTAFVALTAGLEGKSPVPSAPSKTLRLPGSMAEEFGTYQQAAEEGVLVKTKTGDLPASKAREIWEAANGPVPEGYDVDHIIQRQFGGTDDLWNLQLKLSGLNRSQGSKAMWLNKPHPYGTIFTDVELVH